MQCLIILNYLICILSLIEYCASISFTNQNYDGIQVGVPFNLTWECAKGDVVLGLLFRTNDSSPQNTTIIASGITESQYTWTPPDWATDFFAQKIEAQDGAKNLALTGNFTIANVMSAATSIQQNANVAATSASSFITAKTANAQPASSSPVSQNPTEATRNRVDLAAKFRIGFGICIVVILVIIGVALIFFEHGKRVAARVEQQQQPKCPFERVEQGYMGLELVERSLNNQEEIKREVKEEEPVTPLLYKKPKLVVELDGGVRDNTKKKTNNEADEERRRRNLSVRSIYELG